MQPAGRFALGVLTIAAASVAALAQSAVISARSGLIHYVEGQVYLGDQVVETKFGVFPEVKENQQLKTEEGRAEVLLTPGVFLRIGENSSFRMVTNRLIDTRLEFLKGAAVVEADDIAKDNSVTVVYGDATVHPVKKGIYRFDSENNELRVFDGLAEVSGGGQTVEVKEGHAIALDTLAVSKFDKTVTDALNRWSERRDQYVSMANVGAADTLRNSIYNTSAGSPFMGGWYWNPFFGMYSYVPGMGGMFYSPFGNPFFSPFDVYMAYMPGFYYYPGLYGNYGYWGGGYGNPYNTINNKTIPPPSHPTGAKGPIVAGRAPSGGYSGRAPSGNFPVPASSPVSSVSVARSSAGSSHGSHH